MVSSSPKSLAGLLLVLACWIGVPGELRADPLTFHDTYFLIDSAPTRLDLFSNPGVVLEPRTYDGTIFPPALLFGAIVTSQGGQPITDTIRFTYQEQGTPPVQVSQTFTTFTTPQGFLFPVEFLPIHQTGIPVPTTLTVDVLNSSPDFVIPSGPSRGQLVDSYTYSFQVLTPTPEPSTLLLFVAGGVAGFVTQRRRMLRQGGQSIVE